MNARTMLLTLTVIGGLPVLAVAQAPLGAPWDSVGRILKTTGTATGGYYRYTWPRRDITLKIGDVTVAPALAELARQRIAVTAIHNLLVGEDPKITYVHFHADGNALEMAMRLDHVVALTGAPRPVAAAAPAPVTIDTGLVFNTLGLHGRAQGAVAQMSVVLVPGTVTMNGRTVIPALGYGTPINIQIVSP